MKNRIAQMIELFNTGWGRYVFKGMNIAMDVLGMWTIILLLLIIGASHMDAAHKLQGNPLIIEQMTEAQMTDYVWGLMLLAGAILGLYYVGVFLGWLQQPTSKRSYHEVD